MTVEERLEKLERELAAVKRRNRRLLAAAGLTVGLLALAWLYLGTTGPVQAQEAEGDSTLGILETGNIIRANGFVLEDAEGRTRAELGMTEDGPRLRLLDENGNVRVGLLAATEVSGFHLSDDNGTIRAAFIVTKMGSELDLCDKNGNIRILSIVNADGPWLQLGDKNGNVIWQAP